MSEGDRQGDVQQPAGGFGAGGAGGPHGPPAGPPIAPGPSSYQPPAEPGMMGFAYDGDNKKRGGCLTAFLVLMLIANPLTTLVYVAGADMVKRGMPNAPDWAFPVLALLGVVNTASAIGIWLWRKWGVFGVCGTAVVALVINFMIGVPPMNAIFGLAGPGILVFLVRPLWRGFR
ncbi:MAG: hypothetical protein JNL38_12670 [Myxococcales bacterium]|nr:hypothetical protein [Myxococcales bacterium]